METHLDVEMKETSVPPNPSPPTTRSSTRSPSPTMTQQATPKPKPAPIKKKKKKTKFIPDRINPRPENPPNFADCVKSTITVKKVPDPKQDKECPRNKDYVFSLRSLQHTPTNTTWIALSSILFGLGYNNQRSLLTQAKNVYLESLRHWLHECCLKHPLSMFYFVCESDIWISKYGFSLLIPILNSYERTNNMIQHVVRFRFQYLKLFYNFELVKQEPPYEPDPHNFICTSCCLEDVPDQFETICDCNAMTHLRCEVAQTAIPKTEAEKETYFCDNCLELLPMEALRERRLASGDGVFEVEAVLGYNDMKNRMSDEYPHGAYFIRWKNYPAEASEYIALSKSFLPLVKEFWKRQKELEDGQAFQEKARRHIMKMERDDYTSEDEELSSSSSSSEDEDDDGGDDEKKSKRTKKKRKRRDPFEREIVIREDGQLTGIGSKGKRRRMNIVTQPTGVEEERKLEEESDALDDEDDDDDNVDQISWSVDCIVDDFEELILPLFVDGSDASGSNSSRRATTGGEEEEKAPKANGTYRPVSFFRCMDQRYIIRKQQFRESSAQVRRQKVREYRAMVKSGANRRLTNMLKARYGRDVSSTKVPPIILEVDEEWHPWSSELEKQVIDLLNRNWGEWKHDTSHKSFEVGEILDLNNPAKKYTDQSIDSDDRVFGLFATEMIRKGTLLLEYVGVLTNAHEAEEPLNDILHGLDQTTLMELAGPPTMLQHYKLKSKRSKMGMKHKKRRKFRSTAMVSAVDEEETDAEDEENGVNVCIGEQVGGDDTGVTTDENGGHDHSYWGSDLQSWMVIDPHIFHNEAVYMNDYRDNVAEFSWEEEEKKKDESPDSSDDEEYDDDEDPVDESKDCEMDADGRRQPVHVACEDDGKKLEDEEEKSVVAVDVDVEEEKDDVDVNKKNHGKRRMNVKFVEVNVNGWPHVFGVADRDIEEGQELLTDYGANYWANFKEITKSQNQFKKILRDDQMDLVSELGELRGKEKKARRRLDRMVDVMKEHRSEFEHILDQLPAMVRRKLGWVGDKNDLVTGSKDEQVRDESLSASVVNGVGQMNVDENEKSYLQLVHDESGTSGNVDGDVAMVDLTSETRNEMNM